jgi:hypothetical protein
VRDKAEILEGPHNLSNPNEAAFEVAPGFDFATL